MSRRFHYVLSTHWDREWYEPFQHYRWRLVTLIDGILDAMADGRYPGAFTTDGQAILVEDYLEVRPERREEFLRRVREGRIVAGPWYVLPDEFLVSGEALIRNLRRGRDLVRSLGAEPSDAGFLCDMFGHNSQMPQIFAGFGIPGAFLWRGVNLTDRRHFLWEGADGTTVPAYKFGPGGYCDFAFEVRRSHEPRTFESDRCLADWNAFQRREQAATEVDPILVFDGGDHLEWDEAVHRIVAADPATVHSTLDLYLKEMLPQSDRIRTRIRGELREPGRELGARDRQWLIPGVLSSRVWIKQRNAACQALLCHWAEPFSAFARLPADGFLDAAWRWLLQNHPHDSICGCSIDRVHDDMRYRFSQAEQIGERVAAEALRSIADRVEGEGLRIVVFNPLPEPLRETAEIVVPLPEDWPVFQEFFGFERLPAFRLFDGEREIAYQRIAQNLGRKRFETHPTRFARSVKSNEATVSLPLDIPAMGYSVLEVRKADGPVRFAGRGHATSGRSMENELLVVRIESNGTLSATDKRTGERYWDWLTFEDCADIGDGWYHGTAVQDQAFVSTASAADVALVHDGPHVTTFRVRTTMRIPARFEFDAMRRSEHFVELVIDSRVSLRGERLEVETVVDNVADDHRLRVLFPSGAQTDRSISDSAFDVVERPVELRRDNHRYKELEVEGRPQQSWTAVHDERRGVAVVAAGLHEAAVRDLPDRPLALTLFRATRRTVFTDGEPGGQVRGPMAFRYWIVPLVGAPDRAALTRLGQRILTGIRAVATTSTGSGERRKSFLRLNGPSVLTSARGTAEGLEIRLFNPTAEPIRTSIQGPFSRAVRVDLDGRVLGEEALSLGLRPKEIVTLRLS